MHVTNFTVWFSCAVLGARPLSDPAGASDWHDWSAEANCGEPVMPDGRLNDPSAVGSGKFVTPWARMHCANCSSLAEPVLVALAPAAVVAGELALGEELLHPATARAAVTRAAASGPAVTENFLPFVIISMDSLLEIGMAEVDTAAMPCRRRKPARPRLRQACS
jgi:hypothetical protein